jgi:serine/threonine protein phosphatase PrpC
VPLTIVEKASLTDVGRQRQGNEDSYLEKSPLFAVADGMGGARAGEVASKVAVEKLGATSDFDGSPEQHLAEVTKEANREIYKMAQDDPALAGMGTTLTAALVTGREVAIGHVGDSRVYRFRDGELERLTQDHSLVEEFVRQGKLTPEEAENHPQRSIITRALGPEPDVEVETYTHAARDGDVYLLSSDGLTGMVSEDEIAEILRDTGSLDEAARRLIDAANANGGKDNITAVLFRLADTGGDEKEADTLGDQVTEVGVSADEVRAAVDDRNAAGSQATMVVRPGERPAAQAGAPAGAAPAAAAPRGPRGRRQPSRFRRQVTGVIALVVAAALVIGIYAGTRQFWFIGTNSRGVLTLYQGMPYDLPLGIHLYTKSYVSSVPATHLTPHQRDNVLNELKTKSDAKGLITQYESDYVHGR